MVRHENTTRPTLAKFSDSLYPDNMMEDPSHEIVIPRALTLYGKTPQNVGCTRADGVSTSSESSISPRNNVRNIERLKSNESHEPRGPVVMYTDLNFPPNPSQLKNIISNKKDSSESQITLKAKLSSERDRFEQSIMRSREEISKRSHDEGTTNHII